MRLTLTVCGMFQSCGQVAACGIGWLRLALVGTTPQVGKYVEGNGTPRPILYLVRYFQSQPPASGAIRGNIRQSRARHNNIKINALSWQPNANYTAHANPILTAPGHRIPPPLNCDPAVPQPSAPYRWGRCSPARKGDRYRYPVMQPDRPRLSDPYRLLNLSAHPPMP